MRINPAPLHVAQAVLTGLCVVFSLAILGTSAHTLDVFNKQQTSNPWWLPLWAQHFDIHGTKALVGSATATFILSAVFLITSVVPSFQLRNKYTLRAAIGLATTLPSALVSLVTVIYVHILNHNAPDLDTIQTWTCRYQAAQPVSQDIIMPANMGNGNFGALCRESKFALYGMLVVFLLLGFSLVVTIVTWVADKWAAREERKEMEMSGAQS